MTGTLYIVGSIIYFKSKENFKCKRVRLKFDKILMKIYILLNNNFCHTDRVTIMYDS